MALIPPIDDAYINEIIKSAGPYNPALNKTQGVKLRELFKLMRDRFEQQIAEEGEGDLQSVTNLGNTTTNGISITGEDNIDTRTQGVNIVSAPGDGNRTTFITTNEGTPESPTYTNELRLDASYYSGTSFRLNNTDVLHIQDPLHFDGIGMVTGYRVKGVDAVNADEFVTLRQLPTPISLTTLGTTGAATFNGTTLNIPQYSGGSGTIDAIPTDGSTNAVSSNGVFDALVLKADNNAVVHLTGNETIDGIKNFTSDISAVAFYGPNSAISGVGNATFNGSLSVGGTGFFTGNVSNVAPPILPDHLTNKTYVDGLKYNLIAGTNITLSGTYPNITINASGGSGGSIDAIPTDGSANAVSSNGVFDALTGKQNAADRLNNLTVDPSNTKYPTITAVNAGLALKANLNGGNIFGPGEQYFKSSFGTNRYTLKIVEQGYNIAPNRSLGGITFYKALQDGTGSEYATSMYVNPDLSSSNQFYLPAGASGILATESLVNTKASLLGQNIFLSPFQRFRSSLRTGGESVEFTEVHTTNSFGDFQSGRMLLYQGKIDGSTPQYRVIIDAPTNMSVDRSLIFPDETGTIATREYANAKVQNSLTASTTIAPSATAVNTALSGKQNTLTLTTTGTGAATMSSGVLNVPTPNISGKANIVGGNVFTGDQQFGDNIFINNTIVAVGYIEGGAGSNFDDLKIVSTKPFLQLQAWGGVGAVPVNSDIANLSNAFVMYGKMASDFRSHLSWKVRAFSSSDLATYGGTLLQSILTADREWTLPDTSGTVMALSSDTAPTSSSSTGVKGTIIISGGYRYECIATNSWVRSAVTTF